MIKQTTILLFIAILFTGCIEKGHLLKATKIQAAQKAIHAHKVKKQTSVSTKKVIDKKKITIPKKEVVKKDFSAKSHKITSTPKVIIKPETEKIETGFFSSLSDETKNNISGFFVIVIGIIILL